MKLLEKVILTILYSFLFYFILGADYHKINYAAILGLFYYALQEIYQQLKKLNNE